MDSQNAISFRNFASSMGDGRVLAKVDAYIQDHLLDVSEQDDFLKLPRLMVGVATAGLQLVMCSRMFCMFCLFHTYGSGAKN